MRDFIELWAGLNPWLRFGTAGAILLLAAAVWFAGFWRSSMVLGALGVVLLAVSFPSSAEKKGYHDF